MMKQFPGDRCQLLGKLGGQIVAEVGVLDGVFSNLIAADPNRLLICLVDAWEPWREHGASDIQIARAPKEEMDDKYGRVAGRFLYDSRCRVLRTASVRASLLFRRCFFDWVYIDAGHLYEDALTDLMMWWPRIKQTGCIWGDNMELEGVERAVSAFVEANDDARGICVTTLSDLDYVIAKPHWDVKAITDCLTGEFVGRKPREKEAS